MGEKYYKSHLSPNTTPSMEGGKAPMASVTVLKWCWTFGILIFQKENDESITADRYWLHSTPVIIGKGNMNSLDNFSIYVAWFQFFLENMFSGQQAALSHQMEGGGEWESGNRKKKLTLEPRSLKIISTSRILPNCCKGKEKRKNYP